MSRLRRHITYANVISTLALFLVLAGGSALAAKRLHHTNALRPNSVNTLTVKNNTLQSADLKDGAAVTGADVVDGSLGDSDLRDGSVDSSRLLSDLAGPSKVVNGAIVAGKLRGATVIKADLQPESVNGSKVADNSLTGADVAANGIDASRIDTTSFPEVSDAAQIGTLTSKGSEQLVSSTLGRRTTAVGNGEILSNGAQRMLVECPFAGYEKPIAGGPTFLRAETEVLNDGPVTNYIWEVSIYSNQGGPDDFSVSLICVEPNGHIEHSQ
jgi:hypothetical protein